MEKTVSIIGAGIAGLSAGCYLQMNGYKTEIYEHHDKPGGLCTSWKRKDYTFDGCIHWLVGSSPNDNFYNLWNELIDMEKLEFVDPEEYFRLEDRNNNTLIVYRDVDRLEKEMLEKAPEDSKLILDFTKAVRKFMSLSLSINKAPEVMGFMDRMKTFVKILPYIKELKKWSGISARDYANRCKNDLLKKTFMFMFVPEMTFLFLIMTIVWMHKKSAGYPIGGSLNFARLIEKRYLDLGGKVNYNSKVKKILVKNTSANGILLEKGQSIESDIVISAADGYYTIFKMLDGRYVDKKIKDYYEKYEIFPSYIQVSLGISRTLDNEPQMSALPLDEPLVIDNKTTAEYIMARVFNFDPTIAPKGKTVITSMYPTEDHEYWITLKKDNREKYMAEKDRIAKALISVMEKRYGNIENNIEVIDVSTPSTVVRYTNNWKGSFEGWIITPKLGFTIMKKTLPGLDNFYMAGQWVQPGGGLPGVLQSGRNIAQIICSHDKKKFITAPIKTSA